MHKGYEKYKEVLDEGAYAYYTMSRESEGTYPFNQFLSPRKLIHFGEQIGRRIKEREMHFLISLDLVKNDRFSLMSERCSVHCKHFTPVRWVDVENPHFVELVKEGMDIDMARLELGDDLKVFGCFYPRWEGRWDVYSGSLLSNNGSPLAMIFTVEDRLGMPKEQAKNESWRTPPPGHENSKKKQKTPAHSLI